MAQNKTTNKTVQAAEQRTFLLPIDLPDVETPIFALFTRTQIVEIIEPSAVRWEITTARAMQGVCSYGADNFPVFDLPKLCAGKYLTETPQPAKQVIIIRTGEINGNRSFKVAFSSSAPIRSIKLSHTLLGSLKNNPRELPEAVYNRDIIRGFFILPQLHLALLDVKSIARTADKR